MGVAGAGHFGKFHAAKIAAAADAELVAVADSDLAIAEAAAADHGAAAFTDVRDMVSDVDAGSFRGGESVP